MALYNALQKYFTVTNICIPTSFVTHIRNFLYKYFHFTKYTFMYHDYERFNRKLPSYGLNDSVSVIQFTELKLPSSVKSYIYQDMCVQYISDVILKNDELKRFFWQNISSKVLNIRVERQNEYYHSCSGIFVMGQWLANYLINEMGVSPERIHVVGAGADVDVTKYSPDRKGNKFLFVGRDFERKGGSLIIEAFRKIRSEGNVAVELYIVGPKESHKYDAENIFFVGELNKAELHKYYNMCDVFCMPSYIEPFGKVYVEALCFGMPVLARNRFAAPDFIIDGMNGYLIEGEDTTLLAEKMKDLLINSDIKEYVYSHVQEYQKEYSWDNVASKISKVIEKEDILQ